MDIWWGKDITRERHRGLKYIISIYEKLIYVGKQHGHNFMEDLWERKYYRKR